MLPQRFDQARPFLTLGIILLAWAFLPLVVKTFTRATFFEMQAPLTVADSFVQDLQNYFANQLHSKEELREAGKQVAGLIRYNEVGVQRNEELQADILRLENLLNLPPQPAGISPAGGSAWSFARAATTASPWGRPWSSPAAWSAA